MYLVEVHRLVQLVNDLPPPIHRIMLFGHNPGFSDLVDYFCDAGIGSLPTCGLVRIDFALSEWTHLGRSTGTLVWADHPKGHTGQS